MQGMLLKSLVPLVGAPLAYKYLYQKDTAQAEA